MALHLPSGSLKTRSVLEPVPRWELSTYQPISRWLNHCAIRAGYFGKGYNTIKVLKWRTFWNNSTNIPYILKAVKTKKIVIIYFYDRIFFKIINEIDLEFWKE